MKDINLIGCVMRNQLRKLFPDLINSFANLLDKWEKSGQTEHYIFRHNAKDDVTKTVAERANPMWPNNPVVSTPTPKNKMPYQYLCDDCVLITNVDPEEQIDTETTITITKFCTKCNKDTLHRIIFSCNGTAKNRNK